MCSLSDCCFPSEYLTDWHITFCPSDPTADAYAAILEKLDAKRFRKFPQQLRDYSYMYLGWSTTKDDD